METRSKGSPALPKLSAEIWKEEDEIQETAEERAPICSLARDFNFKREPEEENEYVPCTKGAHYVWVKCSQPKNGTFVLSNPDQYLSMNARCQFEGFIPIAFLAALASDSVNWEKIASLRKAVDTNEKKLNKDGKDLDSERDITLQATTAQQKQQAAAAAAAAKRVQSEFIEDWRTGWLIRRKTYPTSYASQQCWVPIRTATGRLEFRCSGPLGSRQNYKAEADYQPYMYKAWWYDVLDKTWEARSKPPQGKPPRWVRVPLSDGMRVLFDSNKTAGLDEVVIKALVEEVNDAHAKELKSVNARLTEAEKAAEVAATSAEKEQCKTTVAYLAKLAEETWTVEHVRTKPDSRWFQFSVHPFGLYSTYISHNDWNTYMEDLAEDVTGGEHALTPRPLIPPTDCQSAAVCQTSTEAVQGVYQGFLNALAGPSGTALNVDSVKTALEKGKAAGLKPPGQTYQQLLQLVSEKHFRAYKCGVRFDSTVNHPKIEMASEKRANEHNQGIVMKASANVVASELGWDHNNQQESITKKIRNENQMRNYLYIAEWLHLRAYSWGGHLNTLEYNGLTSQIPLNLVLGTSETNSVMLRYEKAWQNLFTFEHELWAALGAGGQMPAGQLWIRTNPTAPAGNTIPMDQDDLQMSGRNEWGGIDWIEVDDYDSGEPQGRRFTRKSKPITSSMRKVTEQCPWIAHSIAYHVNMDTYSFALDRAKPDVYIKFYPFSRGFYHRAESMLDGLLFAELKRRGRARAVEKLPDSLENEDRKKKILKADYVPKKISGASGEKLPGSGSSDEAGGKGKKKKQTKKGNQALFLEGTPQGGGIAEENDDSGASVITEYPQPTKHTKRDAGSGLSGHQHQTVSQESSQREQDQPAQERYLQQHEFQRNHDVSQAQQREQQNQRICDYVLQHNANPKGSELAQHGQPKLTPMVTSTGGNPLERQFTAQMQRQYFNNGMMLETLAGGLKDTLKKLGVGYSGFIDTRKKMRNDFIKNSRDGTGVIPSYLQGVTCGTGSAIPEEMVGTGSAISEKFGPGSPIPEE